MTVSGPNWGAVTSQKNGDTQMYLIKPVATFFFYNIALKVFELDAAQLNQK
jgi:hypothetical protein